MSATVFLSEYFDRQIVTRRAMSIFFAKLNQIADREVILDFKNIDFISRSCADEYLKNKINFKRNITEVNLNRDVNAMISLALLQFRKNMGLVV